jgi:hypothetical protein
MEHQHGGPTGGIASISALEEFPEFDDRQGSMPAGALKFSSTSFEAHSRVAIEPIKSDCPHTESIEEGYERTVSRDTRVRGGA